MVLGSMSVPSTTQITRFEAVCAPPWHFQGGQSDLPTSSGGDRRPCTRQRFEIVDASTADLAAGVRSLVPGHARLDGYAARKA
jgi:hypothetical protein